MNKNQTGDYNPLNQAPQQQQHAAPQMQAQRASQPAPAYTAEKKSRKIPMILGVLTIAAFSGIAWVAYESGMKPTPKNAPIISAESTVIKVKPENPGGQTMPHQDKKVYTQIEKTPSNQKPAPYDFSQHTQMSEAPLDSAEKTMEVDAETPIVTSTPVETIEKVTPAPVVPAPKPMPKPAPKPVVVKAPTPTPTPTPAPTPAPVPEMAPAAKAFSFSSYTTQAEPVKVKPVQAVAQKQVAAPVPMIDATYLVQFGAVKSEAQVQTEWQTLSKKFPTQFQNLTLYTEAVTVNGGTLHRVRAGMMTKAQANTMCSTLKQSNVACFAINKK